MIRWTLDTHLKVPGALDPRGYPIMYVGSGYNSSKGKSRVFVISLIDGKSVVYIWRQRPFSLRGSLSFFDSSRTCGCGDGYIDLPGRKWNFISDPSWYKLRRGTGNNFNKSGPDRKVALSGTSHQHFQILAGNGGQCRDLQRVFIYTGQWRAISCVST